MRSIAQTGRWTLEAQVHAYDLLDMLAGQEEFAITMSEAARRSPFDSESVKSFCKEYDALASALDAAYDESALREFLEETLKPLKESVAQAEKKAADLADLHECAKETFAIWQNGGLFARQKALRILRDKAGFRLEHKRIGNYVAKTFDLMNEARAEYARAQQALFNADVSYKIKQGLYLQIKTHLESLFPEYDPLAKGEINKA